MLNKQINELAPTTILTDVDLLVADRYLGSGYYGTRSVTVKNFKETVIYTPPYNIGTIYSGNVDISYSDGILQKALVSGNCTLGVPLDGVEGKHMEFVFTADGSDRLLDFSSSYTRAANVVEVFPIKLKANTVTFVHTYRTATSWMITYIGGNANLPSYTYSELKALIQTNDLLAGRFYKISDFQLMWNDATSVENGLGTVVRSSGVVEPLFVLATSSNTLAPEAYSVLHPSDVLYYDINATYSVGWGTDTTAIPNFKGWVYRRIDTTKNIDIGWDWRYIKNTCYKYNFSAVPDWDSGTTYTKFQPNVTTPNYTCLVKLSGKLYYSLTGTGNINKNPSTNSDYWSPVSGVNETDTYFSHTSTLNILADSYSFLSIPSSVIFQPTFVDSLGATRPLNVDNVKNVNIESGYNNVIISSNFSSNFIGHLYKNTIAGAFYSNRIGYGFGENVISDGFSGNVITNGFSYNFVGSNFANNTTGNTFSHNALGVGFDSNRIGTSFTYNISKEGFKLNTIENDIIDNDFTSSTHVYNNYRCNIFKAVDTFWLSYFGTGGVLITTQPTS